MTYAPGMATLLDAATVSVEAVEQGDVIVVTIRDGNDVAVAAGTPGELLTLAQSLRSVVEVCLRSSPGTS